jgi:hypothetical protein
VIPAIVVILIHVIDSSKDVDKKYQDKTLIQLKEMLEAVKYKYDEYEMLRPCSRSSKGLWVHLRTAVAMGTLASM